MDRKTMKRLKKSEKLDLLKGATIGQYCDYFNSGPWTPVDGGVPAIEDLYDLWSLPEGTTEFTARSGTKYRLDALTEKP